MISLARGRHGSTGGARSVGVPQSHLGDACGAGSGSKPIAAKIALRAPRTTSSSLDGDVAVWNSQRAVSSAHSGGTRVVSSVGVGDELLRTPPPRMA